MARGRGRGARGARGRGRGRGRGPAVDPVESSGTQEATQEEVAESQIPPEPVGGTELASVAQGPGGGPGGGDAQGRLDRLEAMMLQVLERLPGGAPAQGHAPGVQPGVAGVEPLAAGVQPAVVRGQPGVAAAEEAPSYLRILEQMHRITTGYFSGGAKPEEAVAWRSRLERNFQALRCPEGYRVDLAVHYLEGDAHLWWRGVTSRRPQAGMTWADFLAEFDAMYFPQEVVDRMQAQFLALTQGASSVRGYDEQFGRLLVYAGREFGSEESQIRRFMQGLRPVLKTLCRARKYATRAELVETAAAIEVDMGTELAAALSPPVQQQQQRRPQQQQAGAGRGGKPAQGQKRKWEGSSGSGQRAQSGQGGAGCYGCGSTEHRVAACPKRREVRTTQACFHCGEAGHIRVRCPKLQMAVAVVQPVQEAAVEVQPLRQLAAPRVFTSAETGGPSARPITGTFNLNLVNFNYMCELLVLGVLYL